MIEAQLTAQRLKEVLDYNPTTGVFTWKVTRARGARAGAIAGSISKDGYGLIGIDGRNYPAHRLAWLHYHGVWPKGDIDHVSLDKLDNRIINLRPASRSQNMANTTAHRDNHSGLKGVFFDRRRQRWASMITKDGRRKWLGYFDTAELAHAAYTRAADVMFGVFARAA